MILFQDIRYLIQDADTVQEHVDLLVDGSRIAAVGKCSPPPATQVVNCADKAMHAGFCNAHTHLWQMLLKGRRDDLPLDQWCDLVILPLIEAVKAPGAEGEHIGYLWTKLGMAEMIRSGVTSFVDMDLESAGAGLAKACLEVGMRGAFALEIVDAWYDKDPQACQASKARVTAFLDAYHDPAPEALVRVLMGPSEPNMCTHKLLEWTVATAKEYHTGIEIHLAETRRDVETLLSARGKLAWQYCEDLGMLSPRLLGVHSVHTRPEEFGLIRRGGAHVIYNPKSNMKLGSGIAPISEMLAEGINVALACDGTASNDLSDMYEEMRAGVMLQKVKNMDPSAMTARDIFRLATENGAKALGAPAGTLYEGKLADLVLLDLTAPHLINFTGRIVPLLVYCAKASDVDSVMVHGKFLMRDKQLLTMDEAAVRQELLDIGAPYCNF